MNGRKRRKRRKTTKEESKMRRKRTVIHQMRNKTSKREGRRLCVLWKNVRGPSSLATCPYTPQTSNSELLWNNLALRRR